jgi:hypothetical protein
MKMPNMKHFTKCAALLLLALPVLLTSCASTPELPPDGAKFRDQDSANFVIRYNSDKTIFRLKPDGHDGPFQRIYTRKQLLDLDARRQGERDLAVVIISYNRVMEVERQIKQGWVQTLGQMNYRRVVFLRANAEEGEWINGLRTVEDRRLQPATGEAVVVAGSVAE